jgi:hypothetical protein
MKWVNYTEKRCDVDKLVVSYVFEGVLQGHLAHWREVEGVVFA